MSLHADLATWAKATLIAANVAAATSIAIRKRAARLKDDPDPLILITLGPDRLLDRDTNDGHTLEFPLDVAIITQAGYLYEDATLWIVNTRATIRDLLLNSTPISNVRWCGYDANPPYPMEHFPAGYDANVQRFTYHGTETIGD